MPLCFWGDAVTVRVLEGWKKWDELQMGGERSMTGMGS